MSPTLRRRGFSLAELTVVLAVAGVLLSLSAPRVRALRDAYSVRAASADLGASFALGRQSALARRTPVALVFDTAHGVVTVRSGGELLRRSALSTSYGILLSANRDSAVYDPRGLGYGLSNLSVTVRRGPFIDTLTMSRLGRTRW